MTRSPKGYCAFYLLFESLCSLRLFTSTLHVDDQRFSGLFNQLVLSSSFCRMSLAWQTSREAFLPHRRPVKETQQALITFEVRLLGDRQRIIVITRKLPGSVVLRIRIRAVGINWFEMILLFNLTVICCCEDRMQAEFVFTANN